MYYRKPIAVNDCFQAEYRDFLQILVVLTLVYVVDIHTGTRGLSVMSRAYAKTIRLLIA